MIQDLFHNPPRKTQYLISVVAVVSVAALGLALHNLIGYRVVALMLLVTVSMLTLFLDIIPVIIAAILSALLWDVLFIPPRFTFVIGTTEDRFLLLMYFIIALIHAVLTYKIKQVQKEVRDREEKSKSIKFYNALLNSLSHELRTPITTIIGATDNLMNAEKLSAKDKTELLSEISIASLRLNQQVENLLGMSRLESGVFQIKKDWCDVKELIYTVTQRFEPAISNYQVSIFVPDNLPLFKLDYGLMEQVLYNLISNALKIVQELVANEELNLHIRPDGSTKWNPEPDFKFVIIEKFLSVENEFTVREGLLLNGYFLLKHLGQRDEKAFGLDKSDVEIEQVPLVYHRVDQVALTRIKHQ